MVRRNIDLLDLVPDDHDEARHLAVQYGDGRVADAVRGPLPERFAGAEPDERVGHVAEVTVLPAVVPDRRDCVGVRGGSRSKGHARSLGNQRADPPLHFVRARVPGDQGHDPFPGKVGQQGRIAGDAQFPCAPEVVRRGNPVQRGLDGVRVQAGCCATTR